MSAFVGTTFLRLARVTPGAGGRADDTDALTLGECYRRMRAGTLRLASAEGQRAMGLALLREGAAP